MNKLLKNTALSAIFLTTTLQTIPAPFDWIFVAWFFGSPQQPQENPDQAHAGVTTDDYIAQFRSDLNGQSCVIPWNEVDEMEKTLRQELHNIDLRDKDMVNQIIRSILCNQVKIGTMRDLNALGCEGFRITGHEFQAISNSYENNMIARLGKMPHLNGEAIAQYFGATRKESIRNSLRNRTNSR